jgi:2,4-dienoyl-CoA reductase-like NADH-dependent reductase (Old Yellow Enzyme family)
VLSESGTHALSSDDANARQQQSVPLFSPLTLRSVTFPNRIAMAPMCQYMAEEGGASPWHMAHLGSRAVGGAGAVFVEMTNVEPEGRITPGCLGLWSDRHAEALQPIAAFVGSQGAIPGIQIAHAGRKGSRLRPWDGNGSLPSGSGWPLIAPSAIRFGEFDVPRVMDESDMDRIEAAFVQATRRAHAAGFQVVELHMAHGYLPHQFLSPLSNHRSDAYGGDLKGRARFPLRVVRAMREVWPKQLPLFVRLSCDDYVEGGFTLAEAVEFAGMLREAGVDLVDCSGGGSSPDERVPFGPGYQVPFARTIRAKCNVATGAVGMITEPLQANAIVADGSADLVFIGRALLADPYWARHAAEALNLESDWPLPYRRAVRALRSYSK